MPKVVKNCLIEYHSKYIYTLHSLTTVIRKNSSGDQIANVNSTA